MLRVIFALLQKRRNRQLREQVSQAVARNENVVDLVPQLIKKKNDATKYDVFDITSCGLLRKRKDFSTRSTPQF